MIQKEEVPRRRLREQSGEDTLNQPAAELVTTTEAEARRRASAREQGAFGYILVFRGKDGTMQESNFKNPMTFLQLLENGEIPPGTEYPRQWIARLGTPKYLSPEDFAAWKKLGIFNAAKEYPIEWARQNNKMRRMNHDRNLAKKKMGYGNVLLKTNEGLSIPWMSQRVFANFQRKGEFPPGTTYPDAWRSRRLEDGDDGEYVFVSQ